MLSGMETKPFKMLERCQREGEGLYGKTFDNDINVCSQ